MMKWFTDLSEGWQIAIFASGLPFVIGGLVWLFKLPFKKKGEPTTYNILNITYNEVRMNSEIKETDAKPLLKENSRD